MDVATAYFRVATITELIGDKDEAHKAYRAALGKACLNTALWHYRQGQTPEALAYYRQTEAVQERIVADRPDWSEYQSDLALPVQERLELSLIHI